MVKKTGDNSFILEEGEKMYYLRYEGGEDVVETHYVAKSKEIAVVKFLKLVCERTGLNIQKINPELLMVVLTSEGNKKEQRKE